MNFSGKLFTGIIALILIVTACIIPVYIADKWQDVEMSGSSAIPISELWHDSYYSSNYTYIDNITHGLSIPTPYWQSNNSTMIVENSNSNNQFEGKITGFYKVSSTWWGWNAGQNLATFDYDIYLNDIVTHPDPAYKSYVYTTFWFLISAQDMLDNDAYKIRIFINITDNGIGDIYQMPWAMFGRCNGIGGDVTLVGNNLSPFTGSTTHPNYFWLNFTQAELLAVASAQSGTYDIFGIYIWHNGANIVYKWNIDIYYEYYDPVTMDIHDIDDYLTEEQWEFYNYTNSTVYVGADVTVSYVDIQTWILGAFGIGIGILVLAISPLWNPVTDYFTPSGSRGGSRRSRRRSRGRSGRRGR